MRSIFSLSLILTLVFSSAYIYQLAAAVCPIPLSYTIAPIDPRFGVSEAFVVDAVTEAEVLWESATGRELFIAAEPADLTISFVYDDRQERVVAEASFREDLDIASQSSEAVGAEYARLSAEYDAETAEFERAVATHEANLAAYNAEVAAYNRSGGAPPEAFAELKEREETLARVANKLEARADVLQERVARLNQLAREGNELIAQYNDQVENYNQTFGESAEFTQGDFQNNHITIYKFTDRAELVNVLAHEFGHALSIGHVEGESSIMYYLMGAQPNPPEVSEADLAAFVSVCGTTDGWAGWWQRLRSLY